MQQLTPNDIECLIRGSAVFGTGGGFKRKWQRHFFASCCHSELKLASLEEISPKSMVCTAYALGSAAVAPPNSPHLAKKALALLEQMIGSPVSALFPAELNIEGMVWQIASNVGLPVLDADSAGGRAAPEVQLNNFFILGLPVHPLVLITRDAELIAINHEVSGTELELFLRNIANDSGPLIVFGHSLRAEDALHALSIGTISRSTKIGRALRGFENAHAKTEEIAHLLDAKIIFEGKVTEVALQKTERFLQGYYVLSDSLNGKARIWVKNENIACEVNGKAVLTSPDLILCLQRNSWSGIHNSEIRSGQDCAIFGRAASPLWRSPEGVRLFSPTALGIPVTSCLFDGRATQ